MNRNLSVIIGMLLLILLLFGGYVYMNQRQKKSGIATVVPEGRNVSERSTESTRTTLKDLLLANVPQKCEFSDTLDDIDMRGITYVAGGKFRSDFTSTVAGTTTAGHMVYADKTSYIWTEGQTTGFKTTYDPEAVEATPSSDDQQGVDLERAIDYTCSVWLPDNSVFTLPTNVTFTDLAVPTTPQTQPQGSQSACSVCDSLTGEQKTQCRTALNCE